MLVGHSNHAAVRRHMRSRSYGDAMDLINVRAHSGSVGSMGDVVLAQAQRSRSRSPLKPSHKRFVSFGGSMHIHSTQFPELTESPRQIFPDLEKHVEHPNPPCWDIRDVWEWYNQLPWLAGMNYLPRTAVNFVEMWDETSFDIKTINEELAWAADKLGYNTLRTNIPMVLYEQDADGLTKRVNKFLNVCARNGFVVMLCPMDDCEFSGEDAHAGPQPEPVPGLHNSRAIGSPGRKIVMDKSQWYRVEEYIRYVVRQWGKDPRILLLDLYNEPGNPWIFRRDGTFVVDNMEHYEKCSLLLMEHVFKWAREENPTKPLTTSAWHMPDPFFEGAQGIVPLSHDIDQRAMQLSDVISIHAYCDPAVLQATLTEIASFGKPILLTEWMARQVRSTYDTSLPTLKELKIGAYQWGLVKGKSQTNLPWPHVAHKYEGDPMWWHDVLDADGTFHNEAEGEVIRSFVYPQNKAFNSGMLILEEDSQLDLTNLDALHSMHQIHDITETPVIEEGQEAIIPSVCSFSMATINAAAAMAMEEQLANPMHNSNSQLSHGSRSTPTFGSLMSSRHIEGLDLAEAVGGIEF